MNERQELYSDVLAHGGISVLGAVAPKSKNHSFENDEQFKLFVRRAIFKRCSLCSHDKKPKKWMTRQSLLNLLHHYGKKMIDLSALDFLGDCEVIIDGQVIKGKIITKGDGIRGVLGNGPVVYSFVPFEGEN